MRLAVTIGIVAVVIIPPLLIGWSLCMTAARADHAAERWLDADICPGCDGLLEFDDDGANICTNCGATREPS